LKSAGQPMSPEVTKLLTTPLDFGVPESTPTAPGSGPAAQ